MDQTCSPWCIEPSNMMTDSSFPPKVFTLAQQLQAEESQEEREKILIEMAEEAVQDYDPTDAGLADDYHQLFEDFIEAQTQYFQAAFRLGRLVSQTSDMIQSLDKENAN